MAFSETTFEPIQPELAVWPVCSRAALFLPTRIKLKATGAEAIPLQSIMVDVGGLGPPAPCLQSKYKVNLSRCVGCTYDFKVALRLLQSCSKSTEATRCFEGSPSSDS
jgi:hypothetical protein